MEVVSFEIAKNLKEKGFRKPCSVLYDKTGALLRCSNPSPIHYEVFSNKVVAAPTISQVLKWLRKEKNIDVEIHADVGMLGIKVYSPYICTYTEFTLETSPNVVRYRQKKFSPTTKLPHEIIPAHVHFKEWEQAALAGIEYVIDNLI